ncbi:hypothetical protein EVAR_17955_1 [Eumeta japonica]|uniref:Uncharacterized protein n=1 Tax=Eumeta variegata TaxID=151549 RepID=A0A4C1UYC0_EUMVA|nr:hypothetical protein EVAR_17955_1 [Eumeta japonica]
MGEGVTDEGTGRTSKLSLTGRWQQSKLLLHDIAALGNTCTKSPERRYRPRATTAADTLKTLFNTYWRYKYCLSSAGPCTDGRGCGWESLMKNVTLGNVTMSHRTRERPAECLASLSHSTMIGLPRAQH